MTIVYFVIIVLIAVLLVGTISFWPCFSGWSHRSAHVYRECITGCSLTLMMAVLAALLYLAIGTPKVLKQPWIAEPVGEQQLEKLLKEIEKNIAETPTNTEAWIILASGQMMLLEYEKAINSLEKALVLDGNNVEIMVRLADARTMHNNGRVGDGELGILHNAYNIDSKNNNLLWLLAVAYEQRNQFSKALDYWKELAELPSQSPEMTQQIQQQIDRLSLPQLSYFFAITINPALLEKVQPDATLFIFASELNGLPMPIAATRAQAKDIPVTIRLDNNASLSTERPLSSFDRLTITARISNAGEPLPQPGDFFGTITLSSVQATTTQKIEINSVYRQEVTEE